jgi:hypothetical protein
LYSIVLNHGWRTLRLRLPFESRSNELRISVSAIILARYCRVHLHVHANVHAHVHAHAHLRLHVHAHAYGHAYAHVHVCLRVHVGVRVSPRRIRVWRQAQKRMLY